MSLLTMIQGVADVVGIPSPTTVIGNSDRAVRQLLALANLEGEALARDYPWNALVKEATHTTVAAELQGTMASIASGFSHDMSMTYWNRDQNVRVYGPLEGKDWQYKKSSLVNGPYSEFRIQNKSFYMIPAPVAGHTLAFEYVSKNWCESSGGTDQDALAADDDVGILDEYLMKLGVIYRWRLAKRLSYAEEMREYNVQVELAKARDGGNKPVKSLDGDNYLDRPSGIVIPEGNWTV